MVETQHMHVVFKTNRLKLCGATTLRRGKTHRSLFRSNPHSFLTYPRPGMGKWIQGLVPTQRFGAQQNRLRIERLSGIAEMKKFREDLSSTYNSLI